MSGMHGQEISVNAKVETLDGLSAHADRDEILKWLSGFKKSPKQTYIVHGESKSTESLAETIRTKLSWNVKVAVDGETANL